MYALTYRRGYFPPLARKYGDRLLHSGEQSPKVKNILGRPQVQAKLTVGAPDDRFEQEADRVADQVMRMPAGAASGVVVEGDASPSSVQRACPSCEQEFEEARLKDRLVEPANLCPKCRGTNGLVQGKFLGSGSTARQRQGQLTKRMGPRGENEEELQKSLTVQRKRNPSQGEATRGAPNEVARTTEHAVARLRGGGQALPASVRSFMEQRFGRDFSSVRVHHNAEAARLNNELSAQAFTLGNDIFFNPRHYDPATSSGKHLLAHELAHTIQQAGRASLRADAVVQRTIGDGHDLSSTNFSGNVALEAVYDNQRVLRNGHRGAAVRLVQQALVNLGYELPRFGVDGIFGAETEAAVRAFQVDTGAGVDGVVGTQTIGFLDARVQGRPVAPTPTVAVGAALPAANVIVQPGATPTNALGPCDAGLTYPESVSVDMVAVRSGPNWVPVVTGLTGNYSLQARLPPGYTEVTGPGGNTTAANFCAQARELNALGVCPGGSWLMRSAVVAHERVHASRFRLALVLAAPTIEASVEAISVRHFRGLNARLAELLIRLNPAFITALVNAQRLWLAHVLVLVAGDHAAGGPTDTAEHTIVDPMVRRICAHARARSWGACSPPCP